MNNYYITFGQGHVHVINFKKLDKDCVAVMKAVTHTEAHYNAMKLFDTKFHHCYADLESIDMRYYPRGLIYIEEAKTMELITDIGTNRFTEVRATDEPALGNRACHQYSVCTAAEPSTILGHFYFQDGPIKENGVNGVHHEDLITVLIHRLRGFQSGDYACRENAIAITKLEEAMHWLNHRTAGRQRRGVEGTSEK